MHYPKTLLIVVACIAMATVNCAEATGGDASDGADDPYESFLAADGKADTLGIVEGSREAEAVLLLVNEASFETLDDSDQAALDVRAARHIVDYRQQDPSDPGDDETIDTLAELDDIKWVGRRAFGKLKRFAKNGGYLARVDDAGAPTTCQSDADCNGRCMVKVCYEYDQETIPGAYSWDRSRFHSVMRQDGRVDAIRVLGDDRFLEVSGKGGNWNHDVTDRFPSNADELWLSITPDGSLLHFPQPHRGITWERNTPGGALWVLQREEEENNVHSYLRSYHNTLHYHDGSSWVEESIGTEKYEETALRFNAQNQAEVVGMEGSWLKWRKREPWGGWTEEKIATFPTTAFRTPRLYTVHAENGRTHLFLVDRRDYDSEGTLHIVMDDDGIVEQEVIEGEFADGMNVEGLVVGPEGELWMVGTQRRTGDWNFMDIVLFHGDGNTWESQRLRTEYLSSRHASVSVRLHVGDNGSIAVLQSVRNDGMTIDYLRPE